MVRKIMVEVTEEELKELDKEKTLDDYVDGLLKCLNESEPTKNINNMSIATGKVIQMKIYETEKFIVSIFTDGIMAPQVKIESKKGKGLWKI